MAYLLLSFLLGINTFLLAETSQQFTSCCSLMGKWQTLQPPSKQIDLFSTHVYGNDSLLTFTMQPPPPNPDLQSFQAKRVYPFEGYRTDY